MKLTWRIRESFESYVRHARGEITLMPPAVSASGAYVFPGRQEEDVLAFEGGVRFMAYGGMLSVVVADPRIELSGGDGVLSVSDDSGGARIEIARLVEIDRSEVLRAQLRLTVLGARLFGDVYRPGDALDPVTVDLAASHA